MCTSFIKKTENNSYIAMNFDNDGMHYSINTRKKDWFIVYVTIGKFKYPSFGVHKSGIFFNNLMTDACEKGRYRRGKGVVHSTKFLTELIDGKFDVNRLNEYLQTTEIVNVPNFSTHNMICDTQNSVWIIEPGRGNIGLKLKPNEFQVLTNVSIINAEHDEESCCKRFSTAKRLLSESVTMNVEKAFEILQAVKQTEGEWKTEISMVFDRAHKTISYCENQDFANQKEYVFQ